MTARILGMELGIARAVGAMVFSVVIVILMAFIFRHEEAQRQQAFADLTAPLVEVALDAGAGLARRQAALELLAAYGGAEALPRLAELESSDDPVVRSYAVAAGHDLRRRHHRP